MSGDLKDELEIDYSRIDVADIMEQIRRKIASRPRTPESGTPGGGTTGSGSLPPPGPPGPSGTRGRIKTILLKVMKPIAPLIKLLVLPVHQELKDTIWHLYQTNRRLDLLERKLDEHFHRLHQRLTEVDLSTNRRLDEAFEDLNRAKEYIRLLHNLSHNIVVELTKLKIEEENVKLKARIMEKDFEFLDKREKALEKKTFE